MNGFKPLGTRPLVEVSKLIGVELLGSGLAGGLFKSVRQNAWGELYPVPVELWRSLGRPMMETGRMPNGHKSGDAIFVIVDDELGHAIDMAEKRGAPAAVSSGAAPARRPPWWPEEGAAASDWAKTASAQAEAERRIRAAGGNLSATATAAALTALWREAGRAISDDTFSRVSRRLRSGK